MKIISIIYLTSYYPSGKETFRGHFIEKQAKILESKLSEHVIVFKPIFTRKSSKKIGYENFNGIDIYTLEYPNYFRYFSMYKTADKAFNFFKKDIEKILNNDIPKLIISNDLWASLKLGNIFKLKYNSKHITIIHGESPNLSVMEKKMYLKVNQELLICDKVIAVSNKIKNYIKKIFSYEKEIIINGNGIDKEIINKYFNYKYVKNDTLTITSIGNINYNKGFDIVIEALKDLKIPYKYFIIGDGKYKKNLMKLIEKYELTDKIFFTGNIDNEKVFNILERSHFFLLPSRNEAFGIVYLEAMITKNICIGTKGEGCEDFIINGKNGFLISNKKEIRDIILEYHSGKMELGITERAVETAKLNTWEKNVNKLVKVYLNLI